MLRTLHSTLVVAIACMFGVLGRPCMAQPNNQPSTAPLQSSAPTTGSGVKTAFIVQMMIIQMEDAVGAPKGELHEEVLSKIQDVTNDRELMEQLKKIRDFTILSRPQIAMAQNLAASVSGESRAIPYMVRVDENLYRLTATKPERLGIDIAVTGSWTRKRIVSASILWKFLCTRWRVAIRSLEQIFRSKTSCHSQIGNDLAGPCTREIRFG